MIRGFAIARLCGYITVSRFDPIKVSGSPEPGDDREEVEFPWPFLSLVRNNSEILPALLESFVQCYAEVGTRSLDAFEAYRRLFKLGDRNDSDYLSDVEQMLQGQDLPYKCLTPPQASKGADIAERRKQAIAYLDRNIELFSELEKTQLTGGESRTEEGYAVGEGIHNVALREILPLARKCYEEVVRVSVRSASLTGKIRHDIDRSAPMPCPKGGRGQQRCRPLGGARSSGQCGGVLNQGFG